MLVRNPLAASSLPSAATRSRCRLSNASSSTRCIVNVPWPWRRWALQRRRRRVVHCSPRQKPAVAQHRNAARTNELVRCAGRAILQPALKHCSDVFARRRPGHAEQRSKIRLLAQRTNAVDVIQRQRIHAARFTHCRSPARSRAPIAHTPRPWPALLFAPRPSWRLGGRPGIPMPGNRETRFPSGSKFLITTVTCLTSTCNGRARRLSSCSARVSARGFCARAAARHANALMRREGHDRATSGMKAVAGYVAAIAVPLFALDLLGVPRAALFVACLAAAMALPAALARVCGFDATDGDTQDRAIGPKRRQRAAAAHEVTYGSSGGECETGTCVRLSQRRLVRLRSACDACAQPVPSCRAFLGPIDPVLRARETR